MLQVLMTVDNHITWQCAGGEEDELCELSNTAHIADVEYRHRGKSRGAVIALPRCRCGAQCFLKADYTLKELWKAVQPVVNEAGVIWAYVLPLRYVRNVRLHQLLYERGMALYAPVVPMPPLALLKHPQMASIGDPDVVYGLWFGYLAARERVPALKDSSMLALLGEVTCSN